MILLTRSFLPGQETRTGSGVRACRRLLQKALNIEFDVYAILGLALINKMRGKYSEAIESLVALMKNDPKNYRLYTEIAECHIRLGQKDKAVAVLQDFQKLGIRNTFVSELLDSIRQG